MLRPYMSATYFLISRTFSIRFTVSLLGRTLLSGSPQSIVKVYDAAPFEASFIDELEP